MEKWWVIQFQDGGPEKAIGPFSEEMAKRWITQAIMTSDRKLEAIKEEDLPKTIISAI